MAQTDTFSKTQNNFSVKLPETNENGYYEMSKKYNSDIRYRLIFKNKEGFSIGFNLILVPASVSTLGKASASGINMTVTKNSEDKLFKRCAANNAAYDYLRYSREDESEGES